MFRLAEYRERPSSLADYLPWAGLVAPRVVLNKDGSFQRTARFRGPDLDSATPSELIATTARINNALKRLGSGWALFVEAERLEIAQSELLTEAVWLRRLVARALHASPALSLPPLGATERHSGAVTAARGQCSKDRGRVSRLYVRVRREDRLLLHERATARGLASATYLSVLLRSHLRALTPLPKDELAALKRAVGELGAVGRNLNQIARAVNQGAHIGAPGREEFRAILKICEALRDHTKDLIKVNTASWASGYAEDAS